MAKWWREDREAVGCAGGLAIQGVQAATMQLSACFHYASPPFPSQKTHSHYPVLCSHTRLPFVYLCLLLYGLYRHVCLIPLVCIHPLREEEKEVSIANLLKGKRDSHCFFFFLWRALYLEDRMLTLCVPEKNDFFVHFKFCKGFFTDGMS